MTKWREDPLWRTLASMRIEPVGASLSFAARLARENGWSAAYGAAVVEEYRRFLYLAATSGKQVTPSEDVDQAWHLHLTYSRHYWEELCGAILMRPLHHGPTEGGAEENARYREQYRTTLALYRATFEAEPPVSVWPPSKLRFSGRPLRIDASRYWLVPRAASFAAATLLLAACAVLAGNSAGGERSSMTIPLVILAIGVVLFGLALVGTRASSRRKDGGDCGGGSSCGSDSSDSSDGGDSGCGGGCGGGD